MPGLLITTSQRRSAANPPRAVARTSSPSIAGAVGASSTRIAPRPMARRRRMLACPSTPSPQTPTDASASADQEIGWRIALRNAVGALRREEGGGVDGGGPAQLGTQPRQEVVIGAVLALCRQHGRGPAFLHVADALERL